MFLHHISHLSTSASFSAPEGVSKEGNFSLQCPVQFVRGYSHLRSSNMDNVSEDEVIQKSENVYPWQCQQDHSFIEKYAYLIWITLSTIYHYTIFLSIYLFVH